MDWPLARHTPVLPKASVLQLISIVVPRLVYSKGLQGCLQLQSPLPFCRILRASSKESVKLQLAGGRALCCQGSRGEEERGVWKEQRWPTSKEVHSFCAGLPDLPSASTLLCRDTQVVEKNPYSLRRIAPGVLMVPLHVVTVLREGRQQAQASGCTSAADPGSI